MSKSKIIKIWTGCQYVGYFYSENLTWATQNLRLGRMRAAVGHNCSHGRPQGGTKRTFAPPWKLGLKRIIFWKTWNQQF